MALKLGELVAILKTDNTQLKRGLDDGERDFHRTGKNMERDAASTALALASKLTAIGGTVGKAGITAAAGFLGSFGAKFGEKLPSAMSGVFGSLPPQVQGAVAIAGSAIAATMAPLIAAGISSAVLLGVGGGVIAAGIALVASSPGVRKAADSLKNRLLDIDTSGLEQQYKAAQERMTAAVSPEAKARARTELREAKKALDEAQAYNKKNVSLRDLAKPFEGPVKRALETFGKAFDKMSPSIGRMFDQMAPVIDKLAPAMTGMAEKAMPGIEKALIAGQPLWDTLAKHMPEIGNAVSLFFGEIAEGSPGANKFLKDMLNVIKGSIIIMGVLIGWLSKAYGKTRDAFVGAYKLVRSGFDWLSDVPGKLRKVFSKLGGWISAPFKAGFNAIARAWNNTVGRLSWTVPGWVPGFGGNSISAPNIPMLAKGGNIIRAGAAVVGENGPELLHLPTGAQVQPLSPAGGAGGRQAVEIRGEIVVRGDGILTGLRDRIAINGGNVQAVLGTSN